MKYAEDIVKRKVSFSAGRLLKFYDEFGILDVAKSIGADAVDMDLCDKKRYDYRRPDSIYSKSPEEFTAFFEALGNHAKELGIDICQTHGRISGFRNIPEEDDALIENLKLDCLATKLMGAKICVVHTATTIHLGKDAPEELMYKLNLDLFSRILPYAAELGVTIATETFGDATGRGCVDFFGDINHFVKGYEDVIAANSRYADSFKICMDTGHSNKAVRYGNPLAPDVIRRLGGNIVALHLNDNDGLTDQHKIPMTGSIDWKETMDALDEVGYSGYYNMEIALGHFGENFMVEEADFAVKVMKNILELRYTDR